MDLSDGICLYCGFGPEIEELRRRVDGLTSWDAIDTWIYDAVDAGADPL